MRSYHRTGDYSLSESFGAVYAASLDVSVTMNYVMELLAYQQFLVGTLQGSILPPPPPPPPKLTGCPEFGLLKVLLLTEKQGIYGKTP